MGDEEGHSSLRFVAQRAQQDQGVNKLDHEKTPTSAYILSAGFKGDKERFRRGLTHLVGMRRGDEQDGTVARDLPRASRVDFPEEQVD